MSEEKRSNLDQIRWDQQVRMYKDLVRRSGVSLEDGSRYFVQNNVKYIVKEDGELIQQKATQLEVLVWNATYPVHGLLPRERFNMIRMRDDLYDLINEITAYRMEGSEGGFTTSLAEGLRMESEKFRAIHFPVALKHDDVLREVYQAIKGIAQMRGVELENPNEQQQPQDAVAASPVASNA